MNFLLPFFLLLTPMKIQQTIPNDRDAELGLIGACLDGKFDDVRAAGVGEEHFFDLRCNHHLLGVSDRIRSVEER